MLAINKCYISKWHLWAAVESSPLWMLGSWILKWFLGSFHCHWPQFPRAIHPSDTLCAIKMAAIHFVLIRGVLLQWMIPSLCTSHLFARKWKRKPLDVMERDSTNNGGSSKGLTRRASLNLGVSPIHELWLKAKKGNRASSYYYSITESFSMSLYS